jgi:uncharacterized repeat protein (TIGR03803 family)
MLAVLHSFTGGADAGNPVYDGVILGAPGTLYGAATVGGNLTCNHAPGCGTVFKMNVATDRESVLLSFTDATDVVFPRVACCQMDRRFMALPAEERSRASERRSNLIRPATRRLCTASPAEQMEQTHAQA